MTQPSFNLLSTFPPYLNLFPMQWLSLDEARVDGAGSPEKGTAGGALLLIISGEPRQAILTWLSGHVVHLPPLPVKALRLSVAHALETHYDGEFFVHFPR